MHSITLHNMDDLLVARIKEKAASEKSSLNATMKGLLQEALGLGAAKRDMASGYQRFLGRWTAEEAEAFEKSTKDFESIDENDWR